MAVVAEWGHSRIHDDCMVKTQQEVDEIIKRASRLIAEDLMKQQMEARKKQDEGA